MSYSTDHNTSQDIQSSVGLKNVNSCSNKILDHYLKVAAIYIGLGYIRGLLYMCKIMYGFNCDILMVVDRKETLFPSSVDQTYYAP